MADTKISALPAASTPLAGTEVLPVVQSGATRQVSVANLTAGRAVGMLSNTINANTVVPSAGSVTGTNLWVIGANATNNVVLSDAFGGNNFLIFRRSSGTAASPTAVLNGNSLGNIGARGYGSTGYASANRISINMAAAENWTDTAQGTRMLLNTTPNGSTTLTAQVLIENNGDVNIATGNLVQGTAAKGINFTANTPLAGMTSQLLNWYEAGTWTPTPVGITVVSGTPVYTGKYTRIGRQVTIDIAMTNLSGTITIAAGNSFGSLPFTSATTSWGVYGDPGNAAKGGFCTVSGASVYFATANTYTDYFSLTVTYSV